MENFRPEPAEKNEKRIAGWMWLMVPKIEGAHAHRKLHSIDVIERRRMCEKIKREGSQKEQNSFSHGLLARRIRLRPQGGSVNPSFALMGSRQIPDALGTAAPHP